MFAVFQFLESTLLDGTSLPDGVKLFDTEQAARDYIVETLVKHGELWRCDHGKFQLDGSDELLDDEEAIEDWQARLGLISFFHVFDVLEETVPA